MIIRIGYLLTFSNVMSQIKSFSLNGQFYYTKQNLIFTTWKFNNDKNATTPKMARTILRITKERFGDEY